MAGGPRASAITLPRDVIIIIAAAPDLSSYVVAIAEQCPDMGIGGDLDPDGAERAGR